MGKETMVSRSSASHWIDRLPIEIKGTLVVSSTLASKEVGNKELSLHVYPNPVQDILSIQSSEDVESLEVYSLEGRLLKQVSKEKKISVKESNAGVYILKLQISKGLSTHKFIKK